MPLVLLALINVIVGLLIFRRNFYHFEFSETKDMNAE
jgi:hypothetical protein